MKAHNESSAQQGLGKEERSWRSLPADTCAFSQGFTSANFHHFKQHILLAQGAGVMGPHRPVPASQAGRAQCSVSPKCLLSSSSFPAQQDLPRELLLRPQLHRIPGAINGNLKPRTLLVLFPLFHSTESSSRANASPSFLPAPWEMNLAPTTKTSGVFWTGTCPLFCPQHSRSLIPGGKTSGKDVFLHLLLPQVTLAAAPGTVHQGTAQTNQELLDDGASPEQGSAQGVFPVIHSKAGQSETHCGQVSNGPGTRGMG